MFKKMWFLSLLLCSSYELGKNVFLIEKAKEDRVEVDNVYQILYEENGK